MTGVGREIGRFFAGLMFLTRLPAPWAVHDDAGVARSAPYFPLIGAVIGVIGGGTYALASAVLPPGVAAGLALAAGLIATGALHEDGLADLCDGLGGGTTREQALEIMRDSRIGAFGALGLLVSVGLRWAALATLAASQGFVAMILAHTLSRAALPPVMAFCRYARPAGLAAPPAERVSGREVVVALIAALAIAFIAGPIVAVLAAAAAGLSAALVLALILRRLGGYTGDGLGAIQQAAEIAVLVLLAGLWA